MFKANNCLIPEGSIDYVDFSRIKDLQAVLYLKSGTIVTAKGIEAFELALQMRPSILEDKRLKYARHAWAIHNLIGHPVMQILAFFGHSKLGLKVHDATVPKPLKDQP